MIWKDIIVSGLKILHSCWLKRFGVIVHDFLKVILFSFTWKTIFLWPGNSVYRGKVFELKQLIDASSFWPEIPSLIKLSSSYLFQSVQWMLAPQFLLKHFWQWGSNNSRMCKRSFLLKTSTRIWKKKKKKRKKASNEEVLVQ